MNRIFLSLLLGAGLLMSGCAAQMTTTADASRDWRLQSLEESFLDFQEAQRQEAERARLADAKLAQRLDRLEQRVSEIIGEEASPAKPSETAAVKPGPSVVQSSSVDPDMGDKPAAAPSAAMEPKAATPAPVQAGPESEEEKPWAEVPGPALEAQVRKPRQTAIAGAEALYNKGLNLVRSGRLDQGRSTLEQFLKQYAGHGLSPNAMYWIGESWYGQKKYPEAILAFKDVVAKYPKHHKAQAALLKIGMSYRNVGDKDNAVFYLRTLVDDHPGSSPAGLARQLLRQIAG